MARHVTSPLVEPRFDVDDDPDVGPVHGLNERLPVSEVLGVMGAMRAHGGPEIGGNPVAKRLRVD